MNASSGGAPVTPHQKMYSYTVWPAFVDPSGPNYLPYNVSFPLSPRQSMTGLPPHLAISRRLERQFCSGLFHDVCSSMERGDPSRAQFSWPFTLHITVANRFQIILNAKRDLQLWELFSELCSPNSKGNMQDPSRWYSHVLYEHSDAVSYNNRRGDESHLTLLGILCPTICLNMLAKCTIFVQRKQADIMGLAALVVDEWLSGQDSNNGANFIRTNINPVL
ncbi:hypothetical protein EDD18DRAFT_1107990 [Armillaria luteobubalina]|uniref:Uncharacterized protein n=1 Tax=Armillaria luteobubalina TaxID=153913 RepID=A0AA39TL59_9AGAR|nr:hypothetical protein EDD18DRAFT_1107990 [Armillaria luteobubalina]